MHTMLESRWSLLPLALLPLLASAVDHVVTVGKDSQLRFSPEQLTAAVGDTVTYQFFAKNHSVVQSSFADPCHPLAGGFFSGFTPNPSTSDPSATTWTINVNDTKPVWVYCSQTNGNHCQSGMVHSINAPATGNTFDAYKSKAATASTSSSPSDGLPVGGKRILHVDVGKGGNLAFSPNNITELPRTIVQFSFNPKNHSVVQSSFSDPCHPLNNTSGFSSGFIPTDASPSGAIFEIVVKDTKPVWFYCAQTAKTHCQAGMVGSINAPATGNTLQAFIDLAAKAGPSTIPPQDPVGGLLTVNGTAIASLNGAVLNVTALDGSAISNIPPPGGNMSANIWGMAGGGQPANYNWASGNISDEATAALQLLQFLDDLLLVVLFEGFERLRPGGAWAGLYPRTIVNTIGTMAAQALVHRSTATDCLQHYQKPLGGSCGGSSRRGNGTLFATADDFLDAAQALLVLEIGALVDGAARAATAGDAWLVPALAASLGAKSRMAAVVDLMQGRIAAAAPREVALPPALVWSYAAARWGQAAGCDATAARPAGVPDKAWSALAIADAQRVGESDRLLTITVHLDQGSQSGSLFLAWVGPWGGVEFTAVASDGSTVVPPGLFGHAWVVLVNKDGVKVADLPGVTVAGPELVWIGQP